MFGRREPVGAGSPDPRPLRSTVGRRASLLSVFGVVSLVIVIGIGVGIGVVLQDAIRSRAITDAARTGEVAANVGVRPFLQVGDLRRDFMPLPAHRVRALDDSLGSSLSPNGIVRIKVWNRRHWLVYSDNVALRGRWFAGAETLERAFAGELTSEITDLRAPEEREERDFGELLAVYVPLRSDGDGFSTDPDDDVIGAFEIYLPFAPIAADIAADTRRVWVALAIGLALLYVAQFRLVAGASRRIRRQGEQNLHLATHDSLTGLYNRDAFLAAVSGRAGHDAHRPGASRSDLVALFDLDGFQRVNDTLGHDLGDRLLGIIGARLDARTRAGDIVARLGGDEFAFLLRDVAGEETVALLTRLIGAVNEPVDLAGVRLEVRASVGVAELEEEMSGETALQRADIAMYAAKANHSGIEFYRPSLDQLSAETLQLASDVRAGIEGRQFELHYQPKFDIASGEICGCEALIRWNHPERGFVSPARFMPTVEQLPIGRELTDHVLDLALADLAAWQRLGLPLGVSVNLSARDVNDPALPATIEAKLGAHRLDPPLLTVELTEGSLLTDQERTVETLGALRALGCGVSIDDFGTGYASISYVVSLPATELKIDQSFVRELDHDQQAATIASYCIDLAHSLGMRATAEGIETTTVRARLRAMGCDTGQGYLVAEPMPFDALVAFVADHQPTADTKREMADA